MGEMQVASNGEELRTLLGSCIGLALYDRRRKIGGLSHIVLPRSNGATDRPGKFADQAIPTLIRKMHEFAGSSLVLTAKLAGGASMFSAPAGANIGQQNVESCEHVLSELRIPIIARHCGGEKGRRMALNTANGRVRIEIVGQDAIEL
jgi:chemotaxis protein CheD